MHARIHVNAHVNVHLTMHIKGAHAKANMMVAVEVIVKVHVNADLHVQLRTFTCMHLQILSETNHIRCPSDHLTRILPPDANIPCAMYYTLHSISYIPSSTWPCGPLC